MTRWQEFPLRPQGQPWPGLNTKGGRLDPGTGQLEDGSFNAIINESDLLTKRKGFIRGLDERFTGPVCGLFRYTDDCGIEYLVVADSSGIFVRTPFDIPTYLGSDSLPNDAFEAADVDVTRWTNTLDYETFLGSLILTEDSAVSSQSSVPSSRLMQWFKASVLTSYQVEIEYAFVTTGMGQVAGIAIKRDTLGTSYLGANVYLDAGTYAFNVQLLQGGVATTLISQSLEGAELGNGFLRIGYDAETRTVTCRVIPSGGTQVTASKQISEAQDANLGQNSAIGLARASLDQVEILQVSGGALGS